MKKLAYLLICLVLLPGVFAISRYGRSLVYFIVYGNYYLYWDLPSIVAEQNLVKGVRRNVTITVYNKSTAVESDMHLFPYADVYMNVTTPSGYEETFLDMINLNNGSYYYEYEFDEIGTYKIVIRAWNDSIGYSIDTFYVYVGRFPIYAKIVTSTEYKAGEIGEVQVFLTDENGNPITGANCSLTINYPDKSLWKTDTMTEFNFGRYYYTFVVPSIYGTYSVFVNCTRGGNVAYDSSTFHVAKWTEDIKEGISEIEETKDLVDEVKDIVEKIEDAISQPIKQGDIIPPLLTVIVVISILLVFVLMLRKKAVG